MALVLGVHPPYGSLKLPSSTSCKRLSHPSFYSSSDSLLGNPNPNSEWRTLQKELKCEGRHFCFFSDGRKQEQARKALDSALGGKKTEFEKWQKEIERREEVGGGGASGRGGWFGGGGWFGWFHGEHFWEEAQQASLAIIGIVLLFLLITKGNVMFAVVLNPLLFVLRGTRDWLTFVSSHFSRRNFLSGHQPDQMVSEAYQTQTSAKESVVRKWGMD